MRGVPDFGARFFFVTVFALAASSSHASLILSFDSSPQSHVGQGESRFITPADGYVFIASTNFDNGLSFSIEHPAPHSDPRHDHWSLDFAAPFSAPLTVGFYGGATRWPFQDPQDPGLDFSGNHRGNNRNLGFFEVLEAVYGPTGEIQSFAVDFTQYGERNLDWWIHGQLRYNADGVFAAPAPGTAILLLAGLLSAVGLRRRVRN